MVKHKYHRNKWIPMKGIFVDNVLCTFHNCNRYVGLRKKYCEDHKGFA